MVAVVLYITDYKWQGKTIAQHVKEAQKSGLIAEGWKDIQTWISEVFHVGKKIGDELSEKDRASLEGVIKNELKDNVQKLKQEAENKK